MKSRASGVNGEIKLCPSCKEAAVGIKNLLKMFGRDASRADGLQVYCRACRKSLRKVKKK